MQIGRKTPSPNFLWFSNTTLVPNIYTSIKNDNNSPKCYSNSIRVYIKRVKIPFIDQTTSFILATKKLPSFLQIATLTS